MRFIPVPYSPIPPNATPEQRRALYEDHMRRLAAANPRIYWPDGRLKTTWEVIKGIFS